MGRDRSQGGVRGGGVSVMMLSQWYPPCLSSSETGRLASFQGGWYLTHSSKVCEALKSPQSLKPTAKVSVSNPVTNNSSQGMESEFP